MTVPNHWIFKMSVSVAFMGLLANVVHSHVRLVELGAERPDEDLRCRNVQDGHKMADVQYI